MVGEWSRKRLHKMDIGFVVPYSAPSALANATSKAARATTDWSNDDEDPFRTGNVRPERS